MKVRIGDIQISQEERDAINRVLDSNWLSEGQKVKQFQDNWAEYIGTKYCVAVNSGTSALMAVLEALKHHSGHPKSKVNAKVITSPLTYIATVNSIALTGYQPAFVDVNEEDFSLNAENLKIYLENNSVDEHSAVIPVHLLGYPCDMDKINKIAKEHGLAVIEDSCEAHGSRYKEKRTGALSDAGIFSFFVTHNIQVGELGAITTNDLELVRFLDKIKAHGRTSHLEGCKEKESFYQKESHDIDHHPRYYHDILGYNFKTTEFQGALAVEQIKKADLIMEKRLENVKYLNEQLAPLSSILKLPKYDENVSYLGYPLVIRDPNVITRAKLRAELEAKGIETRPLFGAIPLHQPSFAYFKEQYKGKLPNAEKLGANAFYVGCHQYLTREQIDYMVSSFKEILVGK